LRATDWDLLSRVTTLPDPGQMRSENWINAGNDNSDIVTTERVMTGDSVL